MSLIVPGAAGRPGWRMAIWIGLPGPRRSEPLEKRSPARRNGPCRVKKVERTGLPRRPPSAR